MLVSRYWTGKTLDEHKADRAAIVRAVLAEAGIQAPDVNRYSATVEGTDGKPRYLWSPVRPGEEDLRTYRDQLIVALAERHRWRVEHEHAKERAGPGPGQSEFSATGETTAEEAAA